MVQHIHRSGKSRYLILILTILFLFSVGISNGQEIEYCGTTIFFTIISPPTVTGGGFSEPPPATSYQNITIVVEGVKSTYLQAEEMDAVVYVYDGVGELFDPTETVEIIVEDSFGNIVLVESLDRLDRGQYSFKKFLSIFSLGQYAFTFHAKSEGANGIATAEVSLVSFIPKEDGFKIDRPTLIFMIILISLTVLFIIGSVYWIFFGKCDTKKKRKKNEKDPNFNINDPFM